MKVLRRDASGAEALERFERNLRVNTNLGATISLVPLLRQYWKINHYGDPKWYFVPQHDGTVRSAIFQLQQNGPPGAMRPFMTDELLQSTRWAIRKLPFMTDDLLQSSRWAV